MIEKLKDSLNKQSRSKLTRPNDPT